MRLESEQFLSNLGSRAGAQCAVNLVLRLCRCSVRTRRRMRAEPECACQEEPHGVWSLAFSVNSSVISGDGNGLRPMARQGRAEWVWDQPCCSIAAALLLMAWGAGMGFWAMIRVERGPGGWNEICLGQAELTMPQFYIPETAPLTRHGENSPCNGHCRCSSLHPIEAPWHILFPSLCTLYMGSLTPINAVLAYTWPLPRYSCRTLTDTKVILKDYV